MTQKQIRRLMDDWAYRLGIGHWLIGLITYNGVAMPEDGSKRAYADPIPQSCQGQVRLATLSEDVEETLVHELTHHVLAKLRVAFVALSSGLSTQARDVALVTFDMHEEEVVTQLSRALIAAQRDESGQPKKIMYVLPED